MSAKITKWCLLINHVFLRYLLKTKLVGFIRDTINIYTITDTNLPTKVECEIRDGCRVLYFFNKHFDINLKESKTKTARRIRRLFSAIYGSTEKKPFFSVKFSSKKKKKEQK